MKKLLYILLISPVVALAQPVIDYQGAILDTNVIVRNAVIKNAIIIASPYQQIFDTTVWLQNCKIERITPIWFGMKTANTDNTKYLQHTFDNARQNGIYNFYIPAGDYSYSGTWFLHYLSGNEYQGWSMRIYGDGNFWSAKTILRYKGGGVGIAIQRAKGVVIEGIYLRGIYPPPANGTQAYYNTPFPNWSGHSGISIDWDATKNKGGSTGVVIRDTWVDMFDVCYDVSPGGCDNSEIILFDKIRVGNCRIGVRSGQAQEKGNEINYIAAWDKCEKLIQIGKSGKFQAGNYTIRGGNVAGLVVQLFDIECSGWNKFNVYGLYAESIARIGYFGSATNQHRIPISIDNLHVTFAYKSQAGNQTVITSNAQRLKFSNSNLWYYGQTTDTIHTTGPIIFDNCDFGASKLNSNAMVLDNYQGHYYLPSIVDFGKMYYQL